MVAEGTRNLQQMYQQRPPDFIELLRKKDEHAFAFLYEKLKFLCSVVSRRRGYFSPEDVIQETMVRLLETGIDTYDPKKSRGLDNWLLKIISNKLVDMARSSKNAMSLDRRLSEERSFYETTLPSGYKSSEQEDAPHEMSELIAEAYKEKLLFIDEFVLRYVFGLDYEGISLIFGIHPVTARTRVHAVKKRLKKMSESPEREQHAELSDLSSAI